MLRSYANQAIDVPMFLFIAVDCGAICDLASFGRGDMILYCGAIWFMLSMYWLCQISPLLRQLRSCQSWLRLHRAPRKARCSNAASPCNCELTHPPLFKHRLTRTQAYGWLAGSFDGWVW